MTTQTPTLTQTLTRSITRRKTGGPPDKPWNLSNEELRAWLEQLKTEAPYQRAWGLLGGMSYFHAPHMRLLSDLGDPSEANTPPKPAKTR